MQTKKDNKEEQMIIDKQLKAIQNSENDLKSNNVAIDLVSSVIQDAVQNQQQEVFLNQLKSLIQTTNTLSQRLHSAENSEAFLQTTLVDQEIENIQGISSQQQLYTAKLENEVKELKHTNFRLHGALREHEDELYTNNRLMWQEYDDCKRLDRQCRNQYWQIQDLERENMELRKCIEKQPAHFETSSDSGYYEPSTGNTDAQYCQPTYYPTDQNQTFFLDESTKGKPSQTILENEERSSTSPSKHSIPQEEPCISKQMPENDGAWYSTSDAPVNFYGSNKKLQKQVSQKIFRKMSDDHKSRCSYALDTTGVASDDSSALAFGDLSSPQSPISDLLVFQLPEHSYNKISAEMVVPHGEMAFSQNDLDTSSSSFCSNDEKLLPR